ncbi:UBX10 protein, partial [Eurystomus gularis]|nr:UBX10 protein [Eurystomus gularis]
FPSSTAAAFLWTNAIAMHVARPKSAKGCRRPSFTCSQSVEACPCRVPPSLPPAAPHDSVNNQRVSFTKPALPASQVSPENILELLQQVPMRSSSSLNKYRVLPSISWRGPVEAVDEQTDRLQVSEGREEAPQIQTLSGEQERASVLSESDVETSCGCPEESGGKVRQESPSPLTLDLEEPLKEESFLLLAIRSPSGQRFEHHFKPSDSLQMVLAVAEQKTLSEYKHCSVETMEVPRRSFSDLTRSLHECGILHKSMLCIRQKEQHD